VPIFGLIEESLVLDRPRILLVDDTPEILALCTEILQPHYEIVGTAPDGESAIAAFETTTPDVVVLDISMPRLDGIEVARRLRSSGSRAAIVFLSGDVEFMMAALKAGGSGFVAKRLIGSDLRVAIREALAGRIFLSSPA
jgi:DNA-binding NarL/FixJ family response regulator